jgi:uncharacterized MAPEG superfamily protein
MKLLPIAIVITVVVALLLSGPAAIGATQWFVFKTLFFVEFLFAFGKSELRSTILAYDDLVRHILMPP